MMTWKEVKDWAEECPILDEDYVWIGEGGLTFEAEGVEGEELCIEIGGKPDDDFLGENPGLLSRREEP